jgi:adenosylmethionine-8-amino-7-oxononanoate aminotransferase
MTDYAAAARSRIWQFGTSHRKMERSGGPIVFDTADGCYLVDSTGHRYIDALSGVWVVNAGHGNPDIVKAMTTQAARLGYALSEEGFANTAAVDLATRLTDLVGGVYDRAYFTTGGSESVEIALRMARLYHAARGRPGKRTIISREGSYHGATLLTLGLSSYDLFSQAVGPLPDGLAKVVHPTCADCPLKLRYPECGVRCASDLADTIERLGPDTVAAFIAEPVSTSAGVAIPPPEYWPMIREICSRYDVLLVADEVVTGIGRCGDVLATRRFGVEADIVALAKALTSGYAPLGAVLTHRDITAGMPANALLIPGFTFTGHPIACAAATANLDVLCRTEVYDGVHRKSIRLEKALRDRLAGRPHVGGIRVFGLLAAVDITPPPAVRGRRAPGAAELSQLMAGWLLESGLYTRVVEGCIQLGPPLLAPDELMDTIAEHIGTAFDRLAEHLGKAD